MTQWIAAIARGHNSGVCLLKDGKMIFSIEEERLSRKKYDGGPLASMIKILDYTDKLDYLVVAIVVIRHHHSLLLWCWCRHHGEALQESRQLGSEPFEQLEWLLDRDQIQMLSALWPASEVEAGVACYNCGGSHYNIDCPDELAVAPSAVALSAYAAAHCGAMSQLMLKLVSCSLSAMPAALRYLLFGLGGLAVSAPLHLKLLR